LVIKPIDLVALSPQQQGEQQQAAHGTPINTILSKPKDLCIKDIVEKIFLLIKKVQLESIAHRLEVPILKS
jgi:hypothetical protein